MWITCVAIPPPYPISEPLRDLSKLGALPPDSRPRREAEGQAPNACPSAYPGWGCKRNPQIFPAQ